jgi:hypothetical protein
MRQPKPIEQRLREGVSASGRSDVSHRQVPRPVMIAGRPDLEELAEPPDEVGRRSLAAELEDKLGRRDRTIVQ